MISLVCCVAACVSPERATDYRQVVECAARNPCIHGKRISNPEGVTEFLSGLRHLNSCGLT